MSSIVNWIKNNKLASLLILFIVFLLFTFVEEVPPSETSKKTSMAPQFEAGDSFPKTASDFRLGEAPPITTVEDRLVIRGSNLSLLVEDVSSSLEAVSKKVTSLNGYVVDSTLSRSEDYPSANVTVRVPVETLDESLKFFRSLAIKVVSEKLEGEDITDEYYDINARLEVLNRNKARFEEIMTSAKNVDEILKVQESIFSLQNKIDDLVGRQKYLEQNAKLSKVKIYLSTDELSLPYTPSQPWRPGSIFKQALRTFLRDLQGIGTLVIWVTVYLPLWFPVLLGVLYFRRRRQRTQKVESNK